MVDLILLLADPGHVLLVRVMLFVGGHPFLFSYDCVLFMKAFQISLYLLQLFSPLNRICLLYQEVES